MAEVLAIPAALAAVLQLAEYGRHFSKVLYRFSRNASTAKEDVKRFASQVQTFSDTIDLAQVSLDRHFAAYAESPIIAYISRRPVLHNIAQQALQIFDRFQNSRDLVRTIDSGFGFWASIKWSLRKTTVLELFPEMETVKSSLLMLMSTAHLESLTLARENGAQLSEEEHKQLLKRM